jgi:hypothetical protein
MFKIAIIDENLAGQVEQNKDSINKVGIDIVFYNKDFSSFSSFDKKQELNALIIDISLLGNNPYETMLQLLEKYNIKYSLVLYSFEKKELINSFETEFSKAVKKPISLNSLKVFLLSFIIKESSSQRELKNTNFNLNKIINAEFLPKFKLKTKETLDSISDLEKLIDNSNLEENSSKEYFLDRIKNAEKLIKSTLDRIEV